MLLHTLNDHVRVFFSPPSCVQMDIAAGYEIMILAGLLLRFLPLTPLPLYLTRGRVPQPIPKVPNPEIPQSPNLQKS